MGDLVFPGGGGPGATAVRGLIGFDESGLLVGYKPDPGVLGIIGSNTSQVIGHRRVELGPVRAAVGGAENRSGVADNPANFGGGCRAGEEIGVDAADLLDPILTLVVGMFEGTSRADAPKLLFHRVFRIHADFAAQQRASCRVPGPSFWRRPAGQKKLRRIPKPREICPQLQLLVWARRRLERLQGVPVQVGLERPWPELEEVRSLSATKLDRMTGEAEAERPEGGC